MGYCIEVTDYSFTIPADKVWPAYLAACKLNERDELKRGGSSTGEKWFSWVDADYDTKCTNLVEVMDAWRYECEFDKEGNLNFVCFNGEKIGNENHLFAALAPFVPAGAFIQFMGEDGDMWRFVFDGETMHEIKPTINWEMP